MDFMEPLLREHRLLLRLVNRMEMELDTIRDGGTPDLDFLDTAIDFADIYMEESHHAKEETILFAALNRKDIAVDHQHMIDGFLAQHRASRDLAARLGALHDNARMAQPGALADLIRELKSAAAFYRQHIAREETYFFPAAARYLAMGEQESMLLDFQEFDRDFLHKKYEKLLDRFAPGRNQTT